MSEDQNRKYIIPQRLDDPPKFLWWDFDVAILFMGSVAFGIIVAQVIPFFIVGIFIAMFYQKMKAGKSRAYGLHYLYWHLPITFGFKITPSSSEREFIG